MPPSDKKLPVPSRHSSGALLALLFAALLCGLGGAVSWYERGVEAEARVLADEIAVSVVPDEALVPSAVKGARVDNAALAAALAPRFVPRDEPVVALRLVEDAARAAGVTSSFSRVEVTGWDGDPERFGDSGGAAATSSPYAAVVATVEATGAWPKVLAFAAALDALPVASRVDAVRLAAAVDAKGAGVWALSAEISVAAK